MHPFGKPPSASNSAQPAPANGSAATSPNVPTSQLGSASRNGTPASTPGAGNGLRPSYDFMTEAARRERDLDRARDMTIKPTYSTSYSTSMPRPSDTPTSSAHSHLPQHHHHHHHPHHPGSNPTSASSTPRDERPSPFASTSSSTIGAAGAPRRPDPMSLGFGSGLGRLGAGYGLFGAGPFIRDQEYKEKERLALAREREREKEREREREKERERERERSAKPHSIETSPSHRNPNPTNSYSRPSLPPSPTTSRTLPAPASTGKPSISPQIPPASATSATGSASRPNLPLPSFGSLGSRSLPSPFERDARERSTSTTVAASPNPTPAIESASTITGHRRTPSGSSQRGNEPLVSGSKSPVKTSSQPATTVRSLFGPPQLFNEAAKSRDGQRSPVSRIQTTVTPRDRDSAISPTTATAAPPSKNVPPVASATPASQSTRAPFGGYSGLGGPAYHGSFGGFGLGGFGGYGAFGPRWADREREREMLEKREEERKRSQKEAAEAKAKAEREKDDRFADWVKERERERYGPAPGTAYGVEAFQPPRSNVTTAPSATQASSAQRPANEPSWRQTPATSASAAAAAANQKANLTRHIEVIHQPEPKNPVGPITAASSDGSSVMQQVAPSREPRPYGYKAEPREYQYTPRDKRPRMDAAVEEAQNAHRRSTNTKAAKRRKEEDKKIEVNNNPPVKEKDWSALTNPIRRWPEVGSSQVEQWLKTVPDLNRVVSTQVYEGDQWTLAKSGECTTSNEGGLIIVRIGGGFLGEDWKVRGENGWDESTPTPSPTDSTDHVICGNVSRERKIWGTDVYTDDSDLGLILVHAGWLRWSRSISSPVELQKKGRNPRDQDVINVTVRLVPRLIRYTATERNGVRTRNWGNGHDGSSIVVERVERIAVDKRYLKTRQRKSRISEWARQRQLVSLLPSPNTDAGDEDGDVQDPTSITDEDIYESIMFCTRLVPDKKVDTESVGFVYTPEAMKDWLISPLETLGRSLWNCDLVFTTDEDAEQYQMSLSESSSIDNPLFDLLLLKPSPDGETPSSREEIAIERSFDDIHLLKQGIAVRTQGNKGLLIKPKIWRWSNFSLLDKEKRKDWREEFEKGLTDEDERLGETEVERRGELKVEEAEG
ncbi:hypothetical protein I204_02865 [Kwoniella mangroviensis CBS 8886]|nr:hypothetical protein I204_02865 [Kwoniella mangroviensis CBS 8886]